MARQARYRTVFPAELARKHLAEVQVPYVSPPPVWMPGKEALERIKSADKCSEFDAIEQLPRPFWIARSRSDFTDGAGPSFRSVILCGIFSLKQGRVLHLSCRSIGEFC